MADREAFVCERGWLDGARGSSGEVLRRRLAKPGETTGSFCALAIGAATLAISTTSVAGVTYEHPANAPAKPQRATIDRLRSTGVPVEAMLRASPASVPAMLAEAARPAVGQLAAAGSRSLPRVHFCPPAQALGEVGMMRCETVTGEELPTQPHAKAALAAETLATGPVALQASDVASALYGEAIELAEAAVLERPDEPASRYSLASTYLEAGRFDSAASAFADAIALGDRDEQALLGLAMSLAGSGRADDAAAILIDHGDRIGAANRGVALALVGRPALGSKALEDAIIAGENNVTTRQDLAFAYTLAGRWREAKAIAELDLDPAEAHRRMAQWLATSHPQAAGLRIASYLHIAPPQLDPGQPQALALVQPSAPAGAGYMLARDSLATDRDGAAGGTALHMHAVAAGLAGGKAAGSIEVVAANVAISAPPAGQVAIIPPSAPEAVQPPFPPPSRRAETLPPGEPLLQLASSPVTGTGGSGFQAAAGLQDATVFLADKSASGSSDHTRDIPAHSPMPRDQIQVAPANLTGTAAVDPRTIAVAPLDAIRVVDLLDAVAMEMDPADHATLRASPASSGLVSIADLRSHGFEVTRLANGNLALRPAQL